MGMTILLPALVIGAAVGLWYLGTIVLGKFVGKTTSKLHEEFKDEMEK